MLFGIVFFLDPGSLWQAGAQMMPGALPQQTGGSFPVRFAQTPSQPSAVQAAPEDISRIPLSVGYVLNVQVFNAPSISGLYTVDSKGVLTLPLVGTVKVDRLTLSEAQVKVVEALSSGGFILHPSVSITVQQYTPTYVTVVGEVQSPGRLQLLACHPLTQILAMSGGETLLASGDIEIAKSGGDTLQKIERRIPRGTAVVQGDADVCPGDEVTAKRAGVVYVLGAVTRPGGYVMQEDGDLNVVQALSLAMGTTMQASVESTRVVRRNDDGSIVELRVDYKRMVSGALPALSLRPQDIVYVPVSKAKAIFAGGAAQVLGSTSSAAIYAIR
jgi:polysaccharide export outer membrane protein